MRARVVGIGECVVSKDLNDELVAHGLGSCIALMIWDPVALVAGMLHFMLPKSTLDPDKAQSNPCRFADIGIPFLFRRAYEQGAVKSRLIVMAAGGAQMLYPECPFSIGRQNYLAMRKILARSGVEVSTEDIGGFLSRSIRIEVATGRVLLRIPGCTPQEMCARHWMKRSTANV